MLSGVLKSHGLNGIALWDMGLLLYASPVWWGFTDASNKQSFQAILTRAQRLGFLSPSTPSLSQLCGQADDSLFSAIVGNQYHVLHSLLPTIKSMTLELSPMAVLSCHYVRSAVLREVLIIFSKLYSYFTISLQNN